MQLTRTTISIRPGLLERLKLYARERGRSTSEVIEEGISRLIQEHEHRRLDRMYKTLRKLDGVGEADITDASTTINQVLYGTHSRKGADEQL